MKWQEYFYALYIYIWSAIYSTMRYTFVVWRHIPKDVTLEVAWGQSSEYVWCWDAMESFASRLMHFMTQLTHFATQLTQNPAFYDTIDIIRDAIDEIRGAIDAIRDAIDAIHNAIDT